MTLQTGACQCKIEWAGFYSFANSRAAILNPALADRGVYSADCHNENGRTADYQSQESKFESVLP
jgi:hypothetical protein